jgi:hypothetical protein
MNWTTNATHWRKPALFLPMRIISIILIALTMYLWTGCSRGGHSSDAIDSSAFDSAPASIKQSWGDAQEAAKHLDYVSAVTNLTALGTNQELTAEQSAAVEKSLDLVETRAVAAAEKGNPEATKAVQLIGRRRPAH